MALRDQMEVGYLTRLSLFEKPTQTRILSHRAGEKQKKYVCLMYSIMLTIFFKEQVVFTSKDDNGIILSSSELINLKNVVGFFSSEVTDFEVTDFEVKEESFGHIR